MDTEDVPTAGVGLAVPSDRVIVESLPTAHDRPMGKEARPLFPEGCPTSAVPSQAQTPPPVSRSHAPTSTSTLLRRALGILVLSIVASVVWLSFYARPLTPPSSWRSYHTWADYKAQHEAIMSGAAPPRFYQVTTQPNGRTGGLGNKYMAHFSHLLAAMRSGRALITDDAPVLWADLGIDASSSSVKSDAARRELLARSHGWMRAWPFHRYLYKLLYHKTLRSINWEPLQSLVCGDWPSRVMGDEEVVTDFEAFHGVPAVHLLLHPVFGDWPAGGMTDSGLRRLVQNIYKLQPWVQQQVQNLKAETACGVMGPHDIGVHMRVTEWLHWPRGQESASVYAAAVLSSPVACVKSNNCSIYVASDNYTNIAPLKELLEHGTNHRVCWSPVQHPGQPEIEEPLSPQSTLQGTPSLLGLLEMSILSQAQYVLATRYSTFGMMAIAAGNSRAHAIVSPPPLSGIQGVPDEVVHGLRGQIENNQSGSWVHQSVSPFASQSLSTREPYVWDKNDYGIERVKELSCTSQGQIWLNARLFGTL